VRQFFIGQTLPRARQIGTLHYEIGFPVHGYQTFLRGGGFGSRPFSSSIGERAPACRDDTRSREVVSVVGYVVLRRTRRK
jgi:hypothetical protein